MGMDRATNRHIIVDPGLRGFNDVTGGSGGSSSEMVELVGWFGNPDRVERGVSCTCGEETFEEETTEEAQAGGHRRDAAGRRRVAEHRRGVGGRAAES